MAGNMYLLRLLNLPVFTGAAGIAEAIHIDPRDIHLFSKYSYSGHYYREYTIPKRNGTSRIIRQPGPRLKAIQAWILRNILDKLTPSPHASAFVRRRNVRAHVLPHADNRYFLCLDLEDFFHWVKTYRVAMIFELIGYSENVAQILANLCTCKNALPQGGVTSPAISNLVANKLDRRLAGYTSRRNISYSRYADDLTFSCNNPRVLRRALPMLRKIIATSNFKVNEEKTRFLGPSRRCVVTGLTKNSSKSKFGVGRQTRRKLRATIHNLAARNLLSGTSEETLRLNGWLSYLKSVDEESYRSLCQYRKNLSASQPGP
jgi:RNA-directed DNA polymerase